jgi:transcriptional regulator with XRE-family HTH domain
MTTDATQLTAALTQRRNASRYAGFGAALQGWLLRAGKSQKELAKALAVDPSAVTHWTQGQKRPDAVSLVKLLATFHGWFRVAWDPLEALDAIACLGYDWSKIEEASVRHFQPGGIFRPSRAGGRQRDRHRGGSFSPRGR